MSAVSKDPLHGKTLATILEALVAHYGWEHMGTKINVRCFNLDPSIKSSLQFLRKTPWARKKVEEMYIAAIPFLRNENTGSAGSDKN